MARGETMRRRTATVALTVGLLGLAGAAPVAAWSWGDHTTSAAPTSVTTGSIGTMTDATGTSLTAAQVNAAAQEFLTRLLADIQLLLQQLQAAAATPAAPTTTVTQATAVKAADVDADADAATDPDHHCDRDGTTQASGFRTS